jgi:hypothetical protein
MSASSSRTSCLYSDSAADSFQSITSSLRPCSKLILGQPLSASVDDLEARNDLLSPEGHAAYGPFEYDERNNTFIFPNLAAFETAQIDFNRDRELRSERLILLKVADDFGRPRDLPISSHKLVVKLELGPSFPRGLPRSRLEKLRPDLIEQLTQRVPRLSNVFNECNIVPVSDDPNHLFLHLAMLSQQHAASFRRVPLAGLLAAPQPDYDAAVSFSVAEMFAPSASGAPRALPQVAHQIRFKAPVCRRNVDTFNKMLQSALSEQVPLPVAHLGHPSCREQPLATFFVTVLSNEDAALEALAVVAAELGSDVVSEICGPFPLQDGVCECCGFVK